VTLNDQPDSLIGQTGTGYPGVLIETVLDDEVFVKFISLFFICAVANYKTN
jgi:hypothetical protein